MASWAAALARVQSGESVTVAITVTTINSPTVAIRTLAERASEDTPIIVIGDLRTPDDWACGACEFVSVTRQVETGFKLVRQLPFNTYARKMLGYLLAARGGAKWIRETDDDNEPYDSFFVAPGEWIECSEPHHDERWINPYSCFTAMNIWPRGLPLQFLEVARVGADAIGRTQRLRTTQAIVQHLADGDPDVDAVFRLTRGQDLPIVFESRSSIVVPRHAWAPFNSQATTWPRALLPLMYLPVTCSFRMTDIWRSYVAQRIAREAEVRLVFARAAVYQARNEHCLLQDFEQEIEGYRGYAKFVDTLERLSLGDAADDPGECLFRCYEALVATGLIAAGELTHLAAWLHDLRELPQATDNPWVRSG